jgi:hypothetical protein
MLICGAGGRLFGNNFLRNQSKQNIKKKKKSEDTTATTRCFPFLKNKSKITKNRAIPTNTTSTSIPITPPKTPL